MKNFYLPFARPPGDSLFAASQFFRGRRSLLPGKVLGSAGRGLGNPAADETLRAIRKESKGEVATRLIFVVGVREMPLGACHRA